MTRVITIQLPGSPGPAGPPGAVGPANTLSLGTISTGTAGSEAVVTITGTPPTQLLNLTIPRGNVGATGPQGVTPTLHVGTVTTLAEGGSASATLVPTGSDYALNLSIPRGNTGSTGATNSIAIGTVTSGVSASATLTGTAPSQTLNLVLPKGDTGATGATGAAGPSGVAVGLPTGGTTGQLLAKTSNADYATGWTNATSGGDPALTTRVDGLEVRIGTVETTLTAATSSATANTIAKRDGSGNLSITNLTLGGQTSAAHATRKDYVDAIGTRVTTNEAILAAASSANTVSTIATRNSSGNTAFGRVFAETTPPTSTNELTRKDYVDALIPEVQAGSNVSVVVDSGTGHPIYTVSSTSSGGTGSAADFGSVVLDSFSGATDDIKLTAAIAYASAQTYPQTIQLLARQYNFATAGRQGYEGMRIQGPPGYGNPERGADKMPGRVNITGAGAWFAPTTEVFSASFHQLSFTGNSGAWVIGGTANWYCLSMRDIFSAGLRSVVGSVAQKALLTAASFTGDWEINNCYDMAFHLGGSDNVFWSDGMLLDAGTAYVGSGNAHIWFDGMDKSYVGPLYITAEGDWSAIRHTGNATNNVSNNQGGPITYYGLRIEGRNNSASSYGRLISVEGGIAKFHNCAFNFAMSDPSNASLGRTDLGVIMHTGGQLSVIGGNYDRATGVAETVPFVYTNVTSSRSKCIVKETTTSARGGAWTGLPRVTKAAAGVENRDTDSTVTLA